MARAACSRCAASFSARAALSPALASASAFSRSGRAFSSCASAFLASSRSLRFSAVVLAALARPCSRLVSWSARGFAATRAVWRGSSKPCASFCASSVSSSRSSAFFAWPAPSRVAWAFSRRLVSSAWSLARLARSLRRDRTCWAILAASASDGEGGFGLLRAGFGGLELGLLLLEGHLRGVREVGFELALDEVGLGPRGGASLVGELLHALVDAEAQEGDQDLAALLGLALQEGIELALREDDRAGEAVVVEAEDAVHLRPDLPGPVGDGLGRLPRDPLEALLGGLVGAGRARDAVALLPDVELEHDREALLAVADELLVVVAHAGDDTVEGEDDGVDQGRLAGAGRAGDGEEVEAREVELELVTEGSEAFDGQLQRPHLAASSWIWSKSCCSSLGGGVWWR